jgi:DNA-binding response OmpR family regulator
MMYTILVIEDDEGIQKYLKELLLDNGYSVQTASDGVAGLELIKTSHPDLVILDLGLPKLSGETVCRELQKNYPQTPVIILTARDGVSDIVHGLDLGADDYMTKPFIADELLARLRARLRTNQDGANALKVGDLELDDATLEVTRAGKKLQLTPQEFKLLEYLMKNKGRVLTREMILNRIWTYSPDVETRVVDVYMGYLRKKIDAGQKQKLIQSVRGFGYMIKE